MLINSLLEKFVMRGYLSGGELYLPIKTAYEFVQECTQLKITITGIEFFHLKVPNIIPASPINSSSSPLIGAERNWNEAVEACNEFALYVLAREEERDNTQYCNFTVYEECEWTKLLGN